MRSPSPGQVLIAVLMAAALLGVTMLAFLPMFKNQTKASRGIAATGGVTDLSHALDTLFESPACATSGSYLSGVMPVYVNGSGSSYSLSLDTIKFPTGGLVITSLASPEIAQMIQPHSVSAISLIPVGTQGTNGDGYKYPFQLQVTFQNPTGPPALPINKFIVVYTDSGKNVTGACYSGGTASLGKGVSNCTPRFSTSADTSPIDDGANSTARCDPGEFAVSGGQLINLAVAQRSYPLLNASGQPVGWIASMYDSTHSISEFSPQTTQLYHPPGYPPGTPVTLFCYGSRPSCISAVALCCQ